MGFDAMRLDTMEVGLRSMAGAVGVEPQSYVPRR